MNKSTSIETLKNWTPPVQLFEGSADAIQGLETTWHQLNERAPPESAPDVFRDYTLLIASVLDLMDTSLSPWEIVSGSRPGQQLPDPAP